MTLDAVIAASECKGPLLATSSGQRQLHLAQPFSKHIRGLCIGPAWKLQVMGQVRYRHVGQEGVSLFDIDNGLCKVISIGKAHRQRVCVEVADIGDVPRLDAEGQGIMKVTAFLVESVYRVFFISYCAG